MCTFGLVWGRDLGAELRGPVRISPVLTVPLTQLTLSVFPCVYWPVVYVPRRSVFSDLLLISKLGYLFFIVELYGSLYGLDLSPSPEKRFADLSPHSVDCLFHCLDGAL